MIDTILCLLGLFIFSPWIIQIFSTQWNSKIWHRQLLITAFAFELIAVLYIPIVMYIGVGILFLCLIIYLIKERPKIHITPFFVSALLYLAWYAISLLWSPASKKGLQFLIDNGFVLASMAFIPCFIQFKKEEYIPILKLLCYSSCIFIGLSLISWIITSFEIQLPIWEWPILQKKHVEGVASYTWIYRFLGGMKGYIHPSYNLLPIFIATPIAIWLYKKNNLSPYVWIYLWAGACILTLITQSRMGIIYSAIILISNLIYISSSFKLKISIACVVCILSTFGFYYAQDFLHQYGNDQVRGQLHENTIRYIKIKPLKGAGAGALNPIEICKTIDEKYWPHIGEIDKTMEVKDWKPKAHMLPHNQWLADWAHAGIIAAIITLALYICIGIQCYNTKNYWGGVALLIFTIFSLLEPPLYISKGLYLFCLISCLIYMDQDQNSITSPK